MTKKDWENAIPDNVNHPAHYEGSCSLECIDVMQLVFGKHSVIQFCLCNAFKYLWRYKNKNGTEDLNKAGWYINKANELIESMTGAEQLNLQLGKIHKLYEREMEKNEMEND